MAGDVTVRGNGPRFGIAIPQVFVDEPVDMEVVRSCVMEADAAGYESLWTQSQTVAPGVASTLEPVTLLGYVAAVTQRALLGTSVIVATEHDPIQLAKQLSCLDQVTRGRLIIGLGIGAPRLRPRIEGPDRTRPVRWLLDLLAMCDLLWSGEEVSFDGALWGFEAARILPRPYQHPRPPLWLGAHGPQALRRAVRYGDGWMGPGAFSIPRFRAVASELAGYLEEEGRDRNFFTIAKRVYCVVSDRTDAVLARVQRRFEAYSLDAGHALDACLVGPPGSITAQLHDVARSGAELIVLNPLFDYAEQQGLLTDLLASEFGFGADARRETPGVSQESGSD